MVDGPTLDMMVPIIPPSLRHRVLPKGAPSSPSLRSFMEQRNSAIIMMRTKGATYREISDSFNRHGYLLSVANAQTICSAAKTKDKNKEKLIDRYTKKKHTDDEFDAIQTEIIELRRSFDGLKTINIENMKRISDLETKLSMVKEIILL